MTETKQEEAYETLKEELILDPAHIMAIGKVKNVEDSEDKPLIMHFNFLRDNSDLKLYHDLSDKGFPTIIVMKNKEPWVNINKEYYDKACKIINLYKGTPTLHVQDKKDHPVLIRGDDLGFLLAPRITSDD